MEDAKLGIDQGAPEDREASRDGQGGMQTPTPGGEPQGGRDQEAAESDAELESDTDDDEDEDDDDAERSIGAAQNRNEEV